MQRIMVVGGSGFIGHYVTRALAAQGHDVFATHGPGRTMPTIPSVTWIPCDLSSSQPTSNWPSRCHSVIFLAQAREHRHFPNCGPQVFAVNVAGLQTAVTYALEVKACRFLHASTGSIYAPKTLVAHEHDLVSIADIQNYYVASKLASEILLKPYAQLLPTIVLRLFMPYGMGQKPDMLFPQLLDKVRTGKPIHLHGPDGLRANPVAVADVAETFLRCLTIDKSLTMNVGGPEILSLRQISTTMGRVLGRQPLFQVKDQEALNFVGSTSQLQQVLNWVPIIRLENGLSLWVQQMNYPLAG